MSTLHLEKNHIFYARTKHINVRYHFIRNIIEEGDIKVEKDGRKKNPTYMPTMVISGLKLQH